MNDVLNTFAKRLLQARLRAKFSMEKLSEKMNGIVTKQAISKYEKAKMMPSSTILIAMAEALGCDIDYFFRPFTFELDDLKVSFRKKSDTTVGDQKALEVQIQDEVERYLEIENRATGATEGCKWLIISQNSVQDRGKIELLWCY